MPEEPPGDGAEFENDLGKSASNAANGDEVNQFCAEHGPQYADWAKKELARFRAAEQTGFTDTTAEEWLAVNFRAVSMRSKTNPAGRNSV